jgi:hypothetical protein
MLGAEMLPSRVTRVEDPMDLSVEEFVTAMAHYRPLFGMFDYRGELGEKKPMLAHYTSVENVEKVLRSDEVWFSNPLFMNDWEEMRFGIYEGTGDLLSDMPSFIRRVCCGYAPVWGVLRTRLV